MISKESYLEWKDNRVTEQFKKDVMQATEDLVSTLVNRRESKPEDDMYLRGFIRGLVELVNWTPELSNEED